MGVLPGWGCPGLCAPALLREGAAAPQRAEVSPEWGLLACSPRCRRPDPGNPDYRTVRTDMAVRVAATAAHACQPTSSLAGGMGCDKQRERQPSCLQR